MRLVGQAIETRWVVTPCGLDRDRITKAAGAPEALLHVEIGRVRGPDHVGGSRTRNVRAQPARIGHIRHQKSHVACATFDDIRPHPGELWVGGRSDLQNPQQRGHARMDKSA